MPQASYKDANNRQTKGRSTNTAKWRKTPLLVMTGVAFLAMTALALPGKNTDEAGQRHEVKLNFATDSAEQTTTEQPAFTQEEALEWQTETVRSGDNLTTIFKRASLSASEVYQIVAADSDKVFNAIRPGEELSLGVDSKGELQQLRYQKSRLKSYQFHRTEEGFNSEKTELQPDVFTAYREGVIEDSLFLAGERANMSDGVIMELANIFGWDIDFVFDIRKGDRFSLIYEEKFLDGEKIGDGDILAAEFVNQGKTYRAVRYQHENGDTEYYTPEGRSMRKAFLRAPLDVFRISSHFNMRRKHPVHKRIKAHRGVDYAAPRGTPVFAAGKGKVIASGYNRANGNYVFIQHGQRYVTKYLHLHKRYVKKGQTVAQRKTIGTVGSTGYSTGPHLHFEFLVNGVHRNPRTVKLPQAKPINKSIKNQFDKSSQLLLAKLDSYSQELRLAMADTAAEQSTR